MHIYLIGMMACGKTTVGKYLATKLEYEFVDTDELIEKNMNMTISNIINNHGLDYFRNLETNVLKQTELPINTVIATGGGIILNEDNVRYMKNNGVVVYLKLSIEELENRIKIIGIDTRPLLQNNSLKEIYQARKDLYENSSEIIVNCDRLAVKSISEKLIQKLT